MHTGALMAAGNAVVRVLRGRGRARPGNDTANDG
jgi:hypothetical protein